MSPGTIIGRYIIRSRLSAGQPDEIYLADDIYIGHDVAIWLLPKELFETYLSTQRIKRELRSALDFHHPGILKVYEVGDHRGQYFIVTEAFDRSLRDRLSVAPIKLPEALDIAIQIAAALGVAHSYEIIHGDLRPETVVLQRNKVKVAGFGLARLHNYLSWEHIAEETDFLTQGVVMGSVAYMSPE